MNNNIIPLDYKGQQVRMTGTKEKPLWVLADVCKVLEISNPRNVVARLEEDEKGVRQIDTLGGKQKTTVVTESGLQQYIDQHSGQTYHKQEPPQPQYRRKHVNPGRI